MSKNKKAEIIKFPKVSKKIIKQRTCYAGKGNEIHHRLHDNLYVDLSYVTRANDKNSYIAFKAQLLLSILIKVISKNSEGEEFVDHNFLSSITRCSSSQQNNNILNQLADILDFKYYNCVTFQGKRRVFGYIIKFTADGKNRIENPALFYSINSRLAATKNIESDHNKFSPKPKKISNAIYIDNNTKNNIKNRSIDRSTKKSIESDFIKNTSKEKKRNYTTQNLNEQISKEKLQTVIKIEPKQLKDFYPLSDEDANILAIASGRNYGLRGLNELLRDVSEKLKDRFFRSKPAFMSYMAKLLKYEMRDMERVNNENFRIRRRDTDQSEEAKQERSIAEQERYLEAIEYSLQVSPEWHLKKKLCAVLERKKAYDLLKSYRFGQIEGDRFKLHLRKTVHLSEGEKEIILNQVKATHEGKESRNRIGEVAEQINSLEIVVLESQSKNQSVLSSSNNPLAAASIAVPSFVGLWGKIRQSLISYYKDLGQALDISWFSKLTPEEDHANKKLTLKAPTNFIMDYVQDNYSHLIEQLCKQEQYKLSGISR